MSFNKPRKKPEPLEEPALYEYAVGALARRMKTVAELKRLLQRRVEEGETGHAKIAAVLERLKNQGYLNDTTYAADYTRMRQENEKFGKRRVQQELYQKGVSPELISRTLETAYDAVDEEQLARRHLDRKRVKAPTNEKESARVARLLIRAGFSTGAIFQVLKRWQASDETLAALNPIDSNDDAGPE